MRRLWITLAVVILACAAYAGVASAAGFNVTVTYDAVDAFPGDGICADAAGNCTLRAAVMEANALPGWDDVSVPGGLYQLGLATPGEDFAAKGDLDIRDGIGIFGQGPRRTVIDPLREDRAFDVWNTRAEIAGLAVRNGREQYGGAVRSQGSRLYLKWDAFYSNYAMRPALLFALSGGGAIASFNTSLATYGVSVFRNTADDMGGGVYLYTAPGGNQISNVENTLVDSNSARRGGGIFVNSAPTVLDRDTISSNSAALGGGVYWLNLPPRTHETTIPYNAGQDCNAFLATGGYNNDTDKTCGFFGPGDLPGVDPFLNALTYAPGTLPNWVRPLLAGSPLWDAGDPATCGGVDEVGQARPISANCDIGSYEQP